MGRVALIILAGLLAPTLAVDAGQRPVTAEQAQRAEREAPQLAQELGLRAGMTVADVGAGFGLMTVAMSSLMGPEGRVYVTDIGASQLSALRAAVEREKLSNVVVVEGASATANLPVGCCDAIFLRDVYHHLTDAETFDRSLLASLKPGGRLAIIDFLPRTGSGVPAGVNSNRGGHGVPTGVVIDELTTAGFIHVKTVDRWPPDDDRQNLFLVLFRHP